MGFWKKVFHQVGEKEHRSGMERRVLRSFTRPERRVATRERRGKDRDLGTDDDYGAPVERAAKLNSTDPWMPEQTKKGTRT